MSGITGGGTTTSQKRTAPWAFTEPYISAGYQEAAKLYSGGPAQYTPWSQTAGLNDIQRATMGGVEQYVNSPELQSKMAGAQGIVGNLMQGGNNPYAGLAGSAQSAILGGLSNQTYDPSQGLNRMMYQGTNDPALQAAMSRGIGATGDVSRSIQGLLQNPLAGSVMNRARPGIQAGITSSNLANAYDLQNQQRMQAGQTANAINQQRAGLAGTLLGAANQYGTQATGLGLQYANPVLNAPIAMLGELSKVGAMQQAANQAQLNDATARWNYQQNAPYENLVKFRNLINPNPAWGVTNSTTTTPGNAGGIGQIAGMVLGGVGGAFAGGPQGAMMGAQIGGGLGSGIGKNFSM